MRGDLYVLVRGHRDLYEDIEISPHVGDTVEIILTRGVSGRGLLQWRARMHRLHACAGRVSDNKRKQ